MPDRVLPTRLAARWVDVPLPAWVSECCNLPRQSTVEALGRPDLSFVDEAARAAVEFYVTELIRTRAGDISDLLVFAPQARVTKDALVDAGCTQRAMNALRRAGLLKRKSTLAEITFGALLELRGLGIRSMLNIGFCAERIDGPQVETKSEGRVLADSANAKYEVDLRAEIDQLASSAAAEAISGADPRFRDLMPLKAESLSTYARGMLASIPGPSDETLPQMALPIDIQSGLRDPQRVAQWARDAQKRIEEIDHLSLNELLSRYLHAASGLKGDRLQATVARLGWSGQPPTTLEASGQMLGITRERMRQIEKKARDRLPSQPVYVPALSKAITLLAEVAPVEIDQAASLLQERGISSTPFSPESVLAAASDLGLDAPFSISTAGGLRMVTRSEHPDYTRLMLTIGKKKAGASGVASTEDVAAGVRKVTQEECTADDVQKTFDASDKLKKLVGGWYWVPDLPAGRNRLVNACRKMLSATSPISISKLRDGVKREYNFRNISGGGRFDLRVPPIDVLRHFLAAHPDFEVEGDMARSAAPLDYRRELGEADQVLVDVLRSNPSAVLDRASIISECIRRGLNPQTTSVELSYSCVVEHIDTNIWTLRGADINPAAIEALRKANALRPRESRVRDFGWTKDGRLWIAAVAPPATHVSGVVGCPAGSRDYLAGQRFAAAMPDGTPCGTLGVTKEGTIYGFNVFQRLSDWDPGDLILIEFDLEANTAVMVLGNDELLDAYEAN